MAGSLERGPGDGGVTATDRTRDVEAQLSEHAAGRRHHDMNDRVLHSSALLNRVIAWLQFAESKHTGGVGLTSTALGVIVSFSLFGPPLPSRPRGNSAWGGDAHAESPAGRRLLPPGHRPREAIGGGRGTA
jgi:hypothetical protein